MIDNRYNEKFRHFFGKFAKKYRTSDEVDQKALFDIAVQFVERNRDFVMQYPLVQYWSDVDMDSHTQTKERLLKKYSGKHINLYFHIPFCKTRCTYCNFHIVVGDKNRLLQETIYIHRLKREVDEFVERNSGFEIDTIFIGWGTPSYLSPESMESLLSYIHEKLALSFSENIEYTFEGNPDSFSPEKLVILKKYGINRLSFGVQTFEADILRDINRTYDESVVYAILKEARKAGFTDINIDMIYGLPGSNYASMRRDLEKVSKLDITHVTYYPLYYYDESIISRTGERTDNISDIYGFYDEVVSVLAEAWFRQYGREYFCKDGLIHNYQNNYVSNSILYGFGSSAYSFNGEEVFYKNQNLSEYLKSDDSIVQEYLYDDENLDRRLFVLWSRNIRIPKVNIKNIEEIRKVLTLPLELNLIKEDETSFVLTDKGLKYQEILAHMLI